MTHMNYYYINKNRDTLNFCIQVYKNKIRVKLNISPQITSNNSMSVAQRCGGQGFLQIFNPNYKQ